MWEGSAVWKIGLWKEIKLNSKKKKRIIKNETRLREFSHTLSIITLAYKDPGRRKERKGIEIYLDK